MSFIWVLEGAVASWELARTRTFHTTPHLLSQNLHFYKTLDDNLPVKVKKCCLMLES